MTVSNGEKGMTTELSTKSYERLDSYINIIINSLQKSKEIIDEYLNAAKEENISEPQAWEYLRSRIPRSTYYRYLPDMYKGGTGRPKKEFPTGKLGETNKEEFNTEGMGVVDEELEIVPIPNAEFPAQSNDEPEEETQSVDCPAATDNDDEHNRLVARIQELEKMVSDLSFQKGSETPQKEVVPPTQQKIRPFILKKEIIPTLIADLNHSLNNDVQMFLCEDSWLYWITGYQSTYSSERKRELAQNFEVLSQLNATS